MKQIFKAVAAILLTGLSLQAMAAQDPVVVTCYGDNSNAYFLVDPDSKSIVISYSKGNFEESYVSVPNAGWSNAHSYVQLEKREGFVHFKVQIITGDVIMPIFETNADVTATRDSNGDWAIRSAVVYHHDQAYDMSGVIGKRCYVQ